MDRRSFVQMLAASAAGFAVQGCEKEQPEHLLPKAWLKGDDLAKHANTSLHELQKLADAYGDEGIKDCTKKYINFLETGNSQLSEHDIYDIARTTGFMQGHTHRTCMYFGEVRWSKIGPVVYELQKRVSKKTDTLNEDKYPNDIRWLKERNKEALQEFICPNIAYRVTER